MVVFSKPAYASFYICSLLFAVSAYLPLVQLHYH